MFVNILYVTSRRIGKNTIPGDYFGHLGRVLSQKFTYFNLYILMIPLLVITLWKISKHYISKYTK